MRATSIRIRGVKSFADSGDIPLAGVNVIVGRNNSGKSVILGALGALQQDASPFTGADVRHGVNTGNIEIELSEGSHRFWQPAPQNGPARFGVILQHDGFGPATIGAPGTSVNYGISQIASRSDQGFVYPLFSKRIPDYWNQSINAETATSIRRNLANLVARFDGLRDQNHPAADRLQRLLDDVIGIKLSSVAHGDGKAVGYWTDKDHYVELSALGSGVAHLLGLVVALCSVDGWLFLIEEPENDIHPAALRALLGEIEAASVSNQFVITTHSSIVLRHLGAIDDSRVYEVAREDHKRLPTSVIREIGRDAESRRAVLANLGYELGDLNVNDAWIIFEESSAERIVRQFLIPWFVPALRGCATIASQGVDDVPRTFGSLSKMVLFLHLDGNWAGRALVLVDGDVKGRRTVESLRSDFAATWPPEAFEVLREANFERYYPAKFLSDVEMIEALGHDERRKPKLDLLRRVVDWAEEDPGAAKAAFEISAAEVIDALKAFESRLM